MKRKLFTLMLILCLVAGLSLTAYASSNHLVDDAGLLTDTEAANLEAKLSQISDRHNVDIVIVAVDSTDGKSPMDFADDYYDYNGYRADGILLLVSMEDSDWWVSTAGYGSAVNCRMRCNHPPLPAGVQFSTLLSYCR